MFLDFGGRNFDEPQVMEPTKPDRTFWNKAYDVALGDLAELVAPSQVVICEGEPITNPPRRNQSLDADCYSRIFGDEFPETEFLSMGNDQQVLDDQRGVAEAFRKLIGAMAVVRLVDRDDRSAEEIEIANQQGIRVLSRRNLEAYLFDDEVLSALAVSVGRRTKLRTFLRKSGTSLTLRLTAFQTT